MKKYLLLSFMAIAIGIIQCKVYAVDISTGLNSWYAGNKQTSDFETLKPDPIFFYGPIMSIKFNDDFNLTFVYLFGKTELEDDFLGMNLKIKRQDCDLALNYRLNDYLKVFGGMKYINYSFKGLTDFDVDLDTTAYGVGPGLGLGATYPIVSNLFLLANLSGFYLWEDVETKTKRTWEEYPGGLFVWPGQKPTVKEQTTKEKYRINEYGINSTLSIAYYIAQASTTISIGGRYQHFINKDNSRDTTAFYGITLTATYTFSI